MSMTLATSRKRALAGVCAARIAAGTLATPRLSDFAILSDDNGSFVYVIGKDDWVECRGVRTGLVTTGSIAVTEGLNGTEQVIPRAGGFINPADKVKPRRVEQGG
jgi:HlyD family secretion protein